MTDGVTITAGGTTYTVVDEDGRPVRAGAFSIGSKVALALIAGAGAALMAGPTRRVRGFNSDDIDFRREPLGPRERTHPMSPKKRFRKGRGR